MSLSEKSENPEELRSIIGTTVIILVFCVTFFSIAALNAPPEKSYAVNNVTYSDNSSKFVNVIESHKLSESGLSSENKMAIKNKKDISTRKIGELSQYYEEESNLALTTSNGTYIAELETTHDGYSERQESLFTWFTIGGIFWASVSFIGIGHIVSNMNWGELM